MPLGSLSENSVSELPVDEFFHHSERTNKKKSVQNGAGASYPPTSLCEVRFHALEAASEVLECWHSRKAIPYGDFNFHGSGHFCTTVAK